MPKKYKMKKEKAEKRLIENRSSIYTSQNLTWSTIRLILFSQKWRCGFCNGLEIIVTADSKSLLLVRLTFEHWLS